MNEKLQNELKELLPYIIVTGILYLLLPLFMGTSEGAATYIIELGAFPLTAVGCGVFYKRKKHHNSLLLCAIAPFFYALTALLYGMWRASWYTVLIYLAAYFLCGYLGLLLADIVPLSNKTKPARGVREALRKPSKRPRRVNVREEAKPAEHFTTEDPAEDLSLDTSTTEDDIEAILNSIHNRKSQ